MKRKFCAKRNTLGERNILCKLSKFLLNEWRFPQQSHSKSTVVLDFVLKPTIWIWTHKTLVSSSHSILYSNLKLLSSKFCLLQMLSCTRKKLGFRLVPLSTREHDVYARWESRGLSGSFGSVSFYQVIVRTFTLYNVVISQKPGEPRLPKFSK